MGVPELFQRERALRPDLLLVIPYLLLSGLGVLMVYTASAPRLELLGQDPGQDMRRQVFFVLLGTVVFIAASLLNARTVRSIAPMAYLGAIVLLIAVFPLGKETNGAQRWIDLGPFDLQPSELAKVAVILALALILARPALDRLRASEIGAAIAIVAVPAVLIFFQPDLGTMLVFGFIGLVMLFVAGTTFRQIGFLGVSAVVGTILLLRLDVLKSYQVARLTAFLDPTVGETAANYNVAQSVTAIGSGGVFGKGIFGGSLTNLSYVPQQASDFIFTAVAEQLGFVGAIVTLLLFAVILWRLLVASAAARTANGRLLAAGVAALVGFHVFVNIGMTVRLLPATGLPLPFVSYGGTFFLAMSLALGLAHSVWIHRSPAPGEL
jgi:rod shape determining protein RodA